MLNRFFEILGRNIRAVTKAVVFNNVVAGVADGISEANEAVRLTYEPEEVDEPELDEVDPDRLLLNVE